MKREKRLQRVADIKQELEQAAGQQVAQSRKQVSLQEQKLQQLLRYREEYRQQCASLSENGIDPARLRDMRRFFDKLDTAIEQQGGFVAGDKRHLENSHQHWIKQRQQAQSISMAATKLQAQMRQQEQRLEQKASDERNLSMAAMRWQPSGA